MSAPVRVVVANDDVFLRNVLRHVCVASGILIVGETSSLRGVVRLVALERPDVVISALSFTDGDLRDRVAEILANGARLLVLSANASPEHVTDLIAHGAAGYLLQDSAPEQVTAAVFAVAAGNVALHPAAASTIVDQWRFLRGDAEARGMRGRRPEKPELTPREAEVLAAMADGLSTKAVALRLDVAMKTVENHKIRIFDKLGVRSQAQAVSVAIAHALLTPPPPHSTELDASDGATRGGRDGSHPRPRTPAPAGAGKIATVAPDIA